MLTRRKFMGGVGAAIAGGVAAMLGRSRGAFANVRERSTAKPTWPICDLCSRPARHISVRGVRVGPWLRPETLVRCDKHGSEPWLKVVPYSIHKEPTCLPDEDS